MELDTDSRDRGIALGLMQEGRLNEAQFQAAVQTVLDRREAGHADVTLLEVLIEKRVLTAQEAQERILTISDAAESVPDDPFAPSSEPAVAAPAAATAPEPAAPAPEPSAPEPEAAADAPEVAAAAPKPVQGDRWTDHRDRKIAMALMQEQEIDEAGVQAAVQTVLQRRANGQAATLLEVLVERGALTEDEAQDRVFATSDPKNPMGLDPFKVTQVVAGEGTPDTARLPAVKPKPPKPASKPVSSRRRMASSARNAAISSRRMQQDSTSKKRNVVFAISALCLVAVGLAIVFAPKDEEPTPTQSDSLAEVEVKNGLEALRAGDRFFRAGRCAEGLAFFDGLDAALLNDVKEDAAALRERLQRGAALLERLEGLEREGAGSRAYREAVIQMHQKRVDADLIPLTQPFLKRAREELGDAFDDLVVFGLAEEDDEPDESREDDDGFLADPTQGREIVTRGDAKRRAAFATRAKEAEGKVLEAIEELEARRTEVAATVAERAQRALGADRALTVPAWRGAPERAGRLEAWERDGFTVKVGERLVPFSWKDAPPELADEVFERGLADDDADGHFERGWRAARGGLLERAEEAFALVQQLDPERAVPDLEALRPLSRLLHGEGVAAVGSLRQVYTGADEEEAEDFRGFLTKKTAGEDGLTFDSTFSRSDGSFLVHHKAPFERECTLIARGVETPGEFYVEFDRTYLVIGRAGTSRVANRFDIMIEARGLSERANDPLLSKLPTDLSWGDLWEGRVGEAEEPGPYGEVIVRVRRNGDEGEVSVILDGKPAGTHEVTFEPGPIYFGIGASMGPLVCRELVVQGQPDPTWVQRNRDAIPFRLEQELQRWRVAQEEHGVSDPVTLPTSAEDDAGLEGISRESIEALRAARHALRSGYSSFADRELSEGVRRGDSEFWAADYVRAVCKLEDHGHGESLDDPRYLLDRALKGIEDFYEAMVVRAELALLEGDRETAERLAHRALRLRPDYAPAHLTLAWLAVHEGRFDEAAARAELGAFLHPSPKLQEQAAQIAALRAGPSWNQNVERESEHYLVRTDLVEEAGTFVEELERVRRLAPRVLPCLKPRPGASPRKGVVFVFARAEDFYRYYYSTAGTRGEYAAGVFNPRSRQLMLFDSQRGEDRTLAVLRHEATHQWVHSLGLALPYWTNEALADYMAGVREVRPGEFETQEWDKKQLAYLLENEESWESLFDLMTLSPEGFYSGDVYLHYAQAFSFVQYCMEGGYPGLKDAFFNYLEAHGRGQADDTSGLAGIRLDHLYAETFHQLDMQEVEAKWRKHAIATGIALGVGR